MSRLKLWFWFKPLSKLAVLHVYAQTDVARRNDITPFNQSLHNRGNKVEEKLQNSGGETGGKWTNYARVNDEKCPVERLTCWTSRVIIRWRKSDDSDGFGTGWNRCISPF